MSAIRRIAAFLKLLFRRDRAESELDAEIQGFYRTMADRDIGGDVPEAARFR